MKIGSFALALLAASLLSAAQSETVESGDVLDGYPVITKLDTSSLEEAGSYKYYFRAAESGSKCHGSGR